MLHKGKGKTMQVWQPQYQAGPATDSLVTVSWLGLSRSQEICAAQCKPEGHAGCAVGYSTALHSTGWGPLSLAVLWVNDFSMSNDLPVRTTT